MTCIVRAQARLLYPAALRFDGVGRLYVASLTSRHVQQMDSQGGALRTYHPPALGRGCVAVSRARRVLVIDPCVGSACNDDTQLRWLELCDALNGTSGNVQ